MSRKPGMAKYAQVPYAQRIAKLPADEQVRVWTSQKQYAEQKIQEGDSRLAFWKKQVREAAQALKSISA